MGIRRPAISTAVAAALIGSAGVPLAAGVSSAATPATTVREDFNGDGYQDVAVAAPGGKVGGHTWAGYITINYGSAHGIDATHTTVISEDTAGVPGASGDDHQFGYALIARDLDGDGLTDLAVTALGSAPQADAYGSVIVLWGSKAGISGQGAVRIATPTGGEVGDDLTAGDFDGDGHTDLFMKNGGDYDYHDVLYGPLHRDGTPAREQQVKVFSTDNFINETAAGDFNGDGIEDLATFYVYENHAEGGKLWPGTKSGLSTTPTALPSAATTAVADFDKDGYADLATRVWPGELTEGTDTDPGTVKIYYGSPTGPSKTRTKTITQSTSGVPGASEKGDQFGGRLGTGDANGDGYPDLAVGVPGEAIGSKAKAGAVVLLKGGKGGLTGTGAQAFHQDTTGVPGVAESGDVFGAALRLVDVTGDNKADLIAGAPGENLGSVVNGGAVWQLRGATGGLTASNSVALNPTDIGAPSSKALYGEDISGDNGPTTVIP
ncbi:FG-GAP and VCBS repeat-containing protein [Streptomyces sp. VRA16 Mangrove soil]|uniref:FG-GAP and VCBS repeat-containing protein n=1 Tax=Streptomyces sp. VRA16 Mangrove soil TaxID=2817434 RepID=UPI001A9E357B|nr:FG-GAP and VCBS repeat-containing protein [Streptomyces sp. VRA16 Mangrove soil]MBO1332790.1 VCBS repeat-containing protein [Streptomyces sp. VRA16 Mangrove soil]